LNFAFQGIYLKIFSMHEKCGSKIRWIFSASFSQRLVARTAHLRFNPDSFCKMRIKVRDSRGREKFSGLFSKKLNLC